VHGIGQPLAGERGLEHFHGEVIDLAVLDAPADERAGVDINSKQDH